MKLEELKQKYELLAKKHALPGFNELNLNFDVGKIKRDSGNLLREIRRVMIDKMIYYLKLVEIMINPSNAPPILLMLLKEITIEDRKIIDSVLNSFVEIELASHKLEVFSNEADEAKLIKRVFDLWEKKKTEVVALIEILERNLKKTNVPAIRRSKDYFN